MTRLQALPLRQLQPSQLHISSAKLAAVAGSGALREPLPVRRYGARLVLTDGHTRALVAHRAGLERVEIVYDEDDLDDDAYRVCVAWCRAAGIESVADLEGRVLSPEDYERLWLERCRSLHRALAAHREGA